VKATFNVSALALEHNPPLGPEIVAAGHDITGHGYRWIEQWHLDRDAETEYIRKAVQSFEKTCGVRPLAWNTKSGRSENTREILAELGFLYDSDSINDDLPHYTRVKGQPWLVVPYALDTNDGRYWRQGWNTSPEFFQYLKDSFDLLYEEGATHPKMLSVGLHSRVSGRPGRAVAVRKFITHIKSHPKVWIARRDDIARWWLKHYPAG
jgi:peptidoglycan/xylan/chitin deacetylase (PgdA/CDA1 family)